VSSILKIGGKLGIVLPDGIYGNDKLGYIREYLKRNTKILAVVDVPSETFQPNTSTKTSIMIAEKIKDGARIDDHYIFMAICETCGHDRRGNPTTDDDVSLVKDKYFEFVKSPRKFVL
jgi:type I restriction enzyme M protein